MDYNYNGYDRGYTEPAMTSADYMNRTYRWMAVGLLITFAAAFVTAALPQQQRGKLVKAGGGGKGFPYGLPQLFLVRFKLGLPGRDSSE